MKKTIALLMALVMVLCLLPSMTLAANSTGHRISVKLYKVVLDSSKPLGYQTPEQIGTITVTCTDSTPHSGYNHFVNLKDFYPTKHGLSTNDWTGWQFNAYYTKGKDNKPFYDWTRDKVNATANVTGSEPYPCSKNFYYVYSDSKPTPPPSAIPSQPGADTLKSLLGNIKVTCVTDTAHGTEEFDLIDGSYTVGAVEGDATSGYTCKVSISPDKYVDEYNKLINGHTVTEATAKIVTLKYNNDSAWVVNTGKPVEFKVQCETEQPTPPPSAIPSQPGADTLKNLLGKIKVTCVTNDTAHGTKEFDLIDGSYTVDDVEGSANSGYTCDVSIFPAKYVAAYNAEVPGHTTEDTAKTVTLKCNDDSAWVVNTGTPVEFNVKCETPQPTAPSVPGADTLKSLLGKIKVTCVTNDTAHGTKEFDLIDGSYTVGAVEGNPTSGYTCEVSISPDKYVEAYNAELSLVHTTEDTAKTVTLKCNDDSAWALNDPSELPVEFNVTCSDEAETFTVTYLDGFSGTYATYTNLKSGVVTPVPANPYRSGYIFLGWQPSVARTVTGDARYVAQWGYIGPQYPNPTPVQPVQPGILPPQTGDMPLWYAIARFLGLVK